MLARSFQSRRSRSVRGLDPRVIESGEEQLVLVAVAATTVTV